MQQRCDGAVKHNCPRGGLSRNDSPARSRPSLRESTAWRSIARYGEGAGGVVHLNTWACTNGYSTKATNEGHRTKSHLGCRDTHPFALPTFAPLLRPSPSPLPSPLPFAHPTRLRVPIPLQPPSTSARFHQYNTPGPYLLPLNTDLKIQTAPGDRAGGRWRRGLRCYNRPKGDGGRVQDTCALASDGGADGGGCGANGGGYGITPSACTRTSTSASASTDTRCSP